MYKDGTYIFTGQAYFHNALKKPMELFWVFLEWLQNEQHTMIYNNFGTCTVLCKVQYVNSDTGKYYEQSIL